MAGNECEIRPNVEKVKHQAYKFGQLNALNVAFAANRGGAYSARGSLFELQVDEKGHITKVTQTNTLGYTAGGKEVTDKVSTIFIYNERGDIKQQIYDIGDDGKYEYVYDFDCQYDENNNLKSHEETMLSKLHNGFKRFLGIEERERGAKTPDIPVK